MQRCQLHTQNPERVVQGKILIEEGMGGMRPPQGYLGTVSKSWIQVGSL